MFTMSPAQHDDNVVNDGFGIYKVNYKTGELLWGDIYNAASGAQDILRWRRLH